MGFGFIPAQFSTSPFCHFLLLLATFERNRGPGPGKEQELTVIPSSQPSTSARKTRYFSYVKLQKVQKVQKVRNIRLFSESEEYPGFIRKVERLDTPREYPREERILPKIERILPKVERILPKEGSLLPKDRSLFPRV